MLLRRVIEHVKKQEWTAVFLDFVIVVVGVFIGIQVSNWNAMRGVRAKEYAYLVRLHQDLQQSIETIDRTIGLLDRQAAGQTVFLDALAQCAVSPDSRAEINYAISTLGYINAPIFSSRTYDELTSSGSFVIIENEEIKTRLSDVVRRVTHMNQSVESIYRITEHHRFTVEENVLYSDVKPYDEYGSMATVDYDIGELCKNKKVASAVSAIRLQTLDRLQAYQALSALYKRLSPLIEKEVSLRWGATIHAISPTEPETAL